MHIMVDERFELKKGIGNTAAFVTLKDHHIPRHEYMSEIVIVPAYSSARSTWGNEDI